MMMGTNVLAKPQDHLSLNQGDIRLVTELTEYQEAKNGLWGGVYFQLKPGWKIYWRYPGESGFSPEFDWSKSENIAGETILWPAPKWYEFESQWIIGYKKDILIPFVILPKEENKDIAINLAIDMLFCSDICVPSRITLQKNIAFGQTKASKDKDLIEKHLLKLPSVEKPDLFKVNVFTADKDGLKLELQLKEGQKFPKTIDFFIENDDQLFIPRPRLNLNKDKKTIEAFFDFEITEKIKHKLLGKDLTITAVMDDQAFEFNQKLKESSKTASTSFFVIAFLAFLGGLILNLMPCVLPVLSIKILSVIKQGGREKQEVRKSFIASSLGIVSSFLVLAAIIILLRSIGVAVGWGMQFQQPAFLIFIAVILTLFASNLWGFYEIILPQSVSDMGLKASSKGKGSFWPPFLTGAFVTLMATPCTAPFLGTAIGFALSQGVFEILAIFALLGIGLAFPYMLIALFPKFTNYMPKPGPWMITLRWILGALIFSTALWLMTVLADQVSLLSVSIVFFSLLGLVIVLWVKVIAKGKMVLISSFIGAGLILVNIAVAISSFYYKNNRVIVDYHDFWEPFAEKAIPDLVDRGKIVYVTVTADWCITCKTNEKLVIGDDDILKALTQDHVVAMKADWTNPDETINLYLSQFNVFGIPFNIVYGPSAPEGIILPELLNKQDIIKALTEAR